jgi:hypothetical protein
MQPHKECFKEFITSTKKILPTTPPGAIPIKSFGVNLLTLFANKIFSEY